MTDDAKFSELLRLALCREVDNAEDAYILLKESGRSEENAERLFETARAIRKKHTGDVFHFSGGIGAVLPCNLKPLCSYCPYWRQPGRKQVPLEAIVEGARFFQREKVRSFHLSGGTTLGSEGLDVLEIIQGIWDGGVRNIDIMVNCGAAMSKDTILAIKEMGVKSIGATFETTDPEVFAKTKPGDDLGKKLQFANDIGACGVGLATGLMAGLGDADEDTRLHQYAKSLEDVQRFTTLKSLYISKFTPVSTIPMRDHPPCSLNEAARYLAVARLMLQKIEISCAAGWMGAERQYAMHAGAGNSLFALSVNFKADYWDKFGVAPIHTKDCIEYHDTRPQYRTAAASQGFTIEENESQ